MEPTIGWHDWLCFAFGCATGIILYVTNAAQAISRIARPLLCAEGMLFSYAVFFLPSHKAFAAGLLISIWLVWRMFEGKQ